MRVIGVLNSGAPETLGETVAAFHRGLGEAGYVDGQNVTINIAGDMMITNELITTG